MSFCTPVDVSLCVSKIPAKARSRSAFKRASSACGSSAAPGSVVSSLDVEPPRARDVASAVFRRRRPDRPKRALPVQTATRPPLRDRPSPTNPGKRRRFAFRKWAASRPPSFSAELRTQARGGRSSAERLRFDSRRDRDRSGDEERLIAWSVVFLQTRPLTRPPREVLS